MEAASLFIFCIFSVTSGRIYEVWRLDWFSTMVQRITHRFLIKVQILLAAVIGSMGIISAVEAGKSFSVFNWKCPLGATVFGNILYNPDNLTVYYEKMFWGKWVVCEIVLYVDVILFIEEALWWWFFLCHLMINSQAVERKWSQEPFGKDSQTFLEDKWLLPKLEAEEHKQQNPLFILPLIITQTVMVIACSVSTNKAGLGLHKFQDSVTKAPGAKGHNYQDLLNAAWRQKSNTIRRATMPSYLYDTMTLSMRNHWFILMGLTIQILLAFYQAFKYTKPIPKTFTMISQSYNHGSPKATPSNTRSCLSNIDSSYMDSHLMASSKAQNAKIIYSDAVILHKLSHSMPSSTDASQNGYVLLQELPYYHAEEDEPNSKDDVPEQPQSTILETTELKEETLVEPATQQQWLNDVQAPSFQSQGPLGTSVQIPHNVQLEISNGREHKSIELSKDSWVNSSMMSPIC